MLAYPPKPERQYAWITGGLTLTGIDQPVRGGEPRGHHCGKAFVETEAECGHLGLKVAPGLLVRTAMRSWRFDQIEALRGLPEIECDLAYDRAGPDRRYPQRRAAWTIGADRTASGRKEVASRRTASRPR